MGEVEGVRSTSSILPMGLLTGKLTQVLGPPSPPVQTLVPTSAPESLPHKAQRVGASEGSPFTRQQDAQCWVFCANSGREQDSRFTQTLGSSCSTKQESTVYHQPTAKLQTQLGGWGPRMVGNTSHNPRTWEVEAGGSEFIPASTT